MIKRSTKISQTMWDIDDGFRDDDKHGNLSLRLGDRPPVAAGARSGEWQVFESTKCGATRMESRGNSRDKTASKNRILV